MDCERARDLIDAYVDRELDAISSLEIEQHIGSCPGCRALYADSRALSARLRDPGLYAAAPEPLRRRIADVIGAELPAIANRPARRQWLLLAAACAGAAILGSGATYWSVTSGGGPSLADEVVASHVRSLLVEGRAIDVASSDEHTVKPWFNGKLDFAPPVVDLTGDGFPLVGGRLDYVGRQTVAALVYRHRQHFINLFLWPAAGAAAGPDTPRSETRLGYNVIHWSANDMAFWAVSDLNPADLEAFAGLIRRRTSG